MTILFSFAHPDDESFAAAGLACQCRASGDRVVLVTATRGDEGSTGTPPLCTREELPRVREAELREAAALLGIEHLVLLGYRDRTLHEADPDEVRAKLVASLRRFRPDIVLTFDPNGFNGHPDHVAISRFTSDAISAAADERWVADAGPPHQVRRLLWPAPLTPAEAIAAGDLRSVPGVDFILDTAEWRHAKAAALRAHRTQHASVEKHFFGHPDPDRVLSIELFRHAWGPPLSDRPGGDIRAGL